LPFRIDIRSFENSLTAARYSEKKEEKMLTTAHFDRRSNCGSFFSSRRLRDDGKTRLLQNNTLSFEFLVNGRSFYSSFNV